MQRADVGSSQLQQPCCLFPCYSICMQGVEGLLRQLSVRWLVLPSIRTVLPMWRYSFNFIPLTLEEQAALEPHIVSPGEDNCC